MPDVLEVPYRPDVIGAGEPGEHAHTYSLGGKTCMTGDIIGDYSFEKPLASATELIFTDMMHYAFVKKNTFNGTPLREPRHPLGRRARGDDLGFRLRRIPPPAGAVGLQTSRSGGALSFPKDGIRPRAFATSA